METLIDAALSGKQIITRTTSPTECQREVRADNRTLRPPGARFGQSLGNPITTNCLIVRLPVAVEKVFVNAN
jgi:hypothetical protein